MEWNKMGENGEVCKSKDDKDERSGEERQQK